jgi:hypothetical protein
MKTETMTRKETRERPILFTGPMVHAILEGRKTQTRRAMKPQPERIPGMQGRMRWEKGGRFVAWTPGIHDGPVSYSPYGEPGDKLWVREAWCRAEQDWEAVYRADMADHEIQEEAKVRRQCPQLCRDYQNGWRASIFMPRWASRITLEVTGVRVQPLNDICRADIIEEGAPNPGGPQREGAYHRWYRDLWESINGAGSWALNPWVWVIEFRRVEP